MKAAYGRQVEAREIEELLACLALIDSRDELLHFARLFIGSAFFFTAIRAVYAHRLLLTQILFEVKHEVRGSVKQLPGEPTSTYVSALSLLKLRQGFIQKWWQ